MREPSLGCAPIMRIAGFCSLRYRETPVTVPVVPMALRGMWASVFSKQHERWGRLPKRIRARIELEAAPPVDGATATAASLEQIVRSLRGEKR